MELRVFDHLSVGTSSRAPRNRTRPAEAIFGATEVEALWYRGSGPPNAHLACTLALAVDQSPMRSSESSVGIAVHMKDSNRHLSAAMAGGYGLRRLPPECAAEEENRR